MVVFTDFPRAALTPVFSAAILTITAAAAMAAWQVAPPPARPPAAQAEAVTPYQLWLTQDVAYIISNDERRAFKSLQSDAEREHFIEQFWQRRDPTPGTVENEMKEEHYRRIEYVNAHFADTKVAGWKTDRGRIYISYGPPDEKESHPSGNATSAVPFEQWLYRWIDGVGTNVVIEFIDPENTGEYRMTRDPSAKDVYAAAPKAGATVQRMLPGAVLK